MYTNTQPLFAYLKCRKTVAIHSKKATERCINCEALLGLLACTITECSEGT